MGYQIRIVPQIHRVGATTTQLDRQLKEMYQRIFEGQHGTQQSLWKYSERISLMNPNGCLWTNN